MADIEFNHVSKRYRVRSDDAAASGGNVFSRTMRKLRPQYEEFWALRDVNFEVNRGEALGIIGHNGAGKSTILKMLASITPPSAGHIRIDGRLSALIEVGSGFHPELSGRENIFLSGTILGMKRREIEAKLDSIVEFAGVRQFVDTPVKRYSSGMYVRLGFAIAAHLDPEILLLDEVLAVGDAAFQAKCLQRIKELEQAGTTIVFISHDLTAVARLCERVILMRKGQIAAEGRSRDVIKQYHLAIDGPTTSATAIVGAHREWTGTEEAPGNEVLKLRTVRMRTREGSTQSSFDIRQPIGVEVDYEVMEAGHILIPNYHFVNPDGLHLFSVQDTESEWRHRPRPAGKYTSTAWIPGNFLAPGPINVDIAVSSHIPLVRVHALEQAVVTFEVLDHFDGDSARGDYMGDYAGVIRPIVDWQTRYQASRASSDLVLNQLGQLG